MTSPAIRLARECELLYERDREPLETFYAKAQAQALRDAALGCDYGRDADYLRRMADELERKA